MFKYFKIVILFICSSVYSFAADRPCFGVEFFPHEGSNLATLNGVYNLALAVAPRVLPDLQRGIYNGVGQYDVYDNNGVRTVYPVGNALNLREMADLAVNRKFIGVNIRFSNPIRNPGGPDNEGALLLLARQPMNIPLIQQLRALTLRQIIDLAYAFQSGGYATALAAFLYRAQRNRNFVNSINAGTSSIAIHVHLQNRVSKDMKEIHNNSLFNFHPFYTTIKDIISWYGRGIDIHSMTVVSYERTATY